LEIVSGAIVSPYLLAAIGLAVGLVSGFVGGGGGYMLIPALIVLGFPADIAVGTSLALIAGNTLIAVVRHGQLGHVDMKMGAIMTLGSVTGVEIGVNLLAICERFGKQRLDIVVLGALIVALASIGILMVRELSATKRRMERMSADELATSDDVRTSHLSDFFQHLWLPPVIRFTKSKVTISGWVVLIVGLITGVLSGFMGVGGGFIASPALIYLIGQPSAMAVGTSLLGILVATSFGCFRHAMLGNVHLAAALVMLLGTAVGTQVGAIGTSQVKGVAVREVLSYAVLTAVLGPCFKMAYFLTGRSILWLHEAAVVLTMLQILVLVSIIAVLLVLAAKYRRGGEVPPWAEMLMINRERTWHHS